MASQSWGQILATLPVAGTNYTTFTTAKSMLTSTASEAGSAFITLPPGFFQRGSILEVDFEAGVSWASGNTMTFQVMLGAVIAFTSGAIKVTTTGGTTIPMNGKIKLTCRSVGPTTQATLIGTMTASGRMIVPASATAGADFSAGSGIATAPETAPAVGTGFDSTVANALDFFLAMGTSSASNGFQLQQYKVTSWGNSTV